MRGKLTAVLASFGLLLILSLGGAAALAGTDDVSDWPTVSLVFTQNTCTVDNAQVLVVPLNGEDRQFRLYKNTGGGSTLVDSKSGIGVGDAEYLEDPTPLPPGTDVRYSVQAKTPEFQVFTDLTQVGLRIDSTCGGSNSADGKAPGDPKRIGAAGGN